MTDSTITQEQTAATTTVDQDSKNMGLLLWIGTLFFGFIPPLVLFFLKADNAYVKQQSKEALNWIITSFIGYFVAGVLSIVVIGLFLFPIIALCHLIFTIMGAISTSKGNDFKVPYAIRLIK